MNERPQNIYNPDQRNLQSRPESAAKERQSGLHQLVFLASELIRSPIAFITVVEGDRQVLGAQIGLPHSLTTGTAGALPNALAFCQNLLLLGEPMLVDSSQDHDQAEALEELFGGGVGSLLGFPLRTAEGQALGCFAAADFKPRSWLPGEVGLLSELSALSVRELRAQTMARDYEALMEDHQLLSQRVAESERARADWEARLHRVQRLAGLGTLACGVAHEFNNLLGAILGNATRAKIHALHGEIELDPIDDILQAGQRAREIAGQVLRYGRDQAAERQLIDLEKVLRQCVSLLRSTLPRAAELHLSCNPNTPPIWGDSTQIMQVVLNLATNAWQALEDRPGQITIALEPSTTELPAPPHGECLASHACLSVSDNGKGMDAETLQRIFEPFFTTKDPDQGAGLGLPIVQGIVQAHGGLIRVRSQIGQGTIFTLLFPSARPEPRITS